MEALAPEARSRHEPLEAVGDAGGIQRPPDWRGEHQAVLLPPLAGAEVLLELADAVLLEGPHGRRGEVDRAPAQPRLRLDQLQPPLDPLEGHPDGERPLGQVDVLPAKAERLPLAETEGESRRVERLEAITTDRFLLCGYCAKVQTDATTTVAITYSVEP